MKRGLVGFGAALFGIAAACSGLGGLTGGGADGCPAGFGDCDGNPENGCETRLDDDTSHCGFCTNVCPTRHNAAPACAGGKCALLCNKGFGDCNGDPADGCEKPTATDPKSCGACVHDCLGGACLDGTCQPQTLASGQGVIGAFAISATKIAYTTQGNIRVIDKQGGSARQVVQVIPTQIALDESHVYYNGSQTFRCDVTTISCSGISGPQAYGPQGAPYAALTVNDGLVTTATYSGPPTSVTSQVHRMPKDAGVRDATTFAGTTIDPNVEGVVRAIAADDSDVFYGTGDSAPGGGPAVVWRFAGNVRTSFADHGNIGWVRAIAIGQGIVVWAAGAEMSSVFTCPRTGCATPQKIGPPLEGIVALAVDETFFYIATEGTSAEQFNNGAILRLPRTGDGAPVVLADKQQGPIGIGVDATHIYWGNRGGEIFRLVK